MNCNLKIKVNTDANKVQKTGLHEYLKQVADAAMKVKKSYPEIVIDIEVVVAEN